MCGMADKCELGKDSGWISSIYNNIGISFFKLRQYIEAMAWCDKAITKAVEGSHCSQQAKSLETKGCCYLYQKQYSKVQEMFQQAIAIAGDEWGSSDLVVYGQCKGKGGKK